MCCANSLYLGSMVMLSPALLSVFRSSLFSSLRPQGLKLEPHPLVQSPEGGIRFFSVLPLCPTQPGPDPPWFTWKCGGPFLTPTSNLWPCPTGDLLVIQLTSHPSSAQNPPWLPRHSEKEPESVPRPTGPCMICPSPPCPHFLPLSAWLAWLWPPRPPHAPSAAHQQSHTHCLVWFSVGFFFPFSFISE